LYRADLKRIWSRSPWWQGATIWLAPPLEAAFTEDCRRGGLDLSRTPPCIANTLRWCWRRSCLNHVDREGWQRALAATRKRPANAGPPPEGYTYQPPSPTPPTDTRIKIVLRKAAAFEPACAKPMVDRTTRTRQHRQKLTGPRTPDGFDWRAFFTHHWYDTFRLIWQTHRLSDEDVDGEVGRVVAVTYRDKLAEESANGGVVGQASRRWHQLLRDLRHGRRPGQTSSASRLAHQVPPIAPSRPASRPVDPVIQEIFDRVLRQT
jgi:hypothetical protein